MNSKVQKLIKISVYFVIVISTILILFKSPQNTKEYLSIFLETVGLSTLPVLFYDRILWKFDPKSGRPIFKKNYEGELKYNYKGINGIKNIDMTVKQTFLSISIKIKTDEMYSRSVMGEIVEESGEYILYYTYRTNPKAEFSEQNPIQFGTCRLSVDDVINIHGSYWTSRNTTGDISLTEKIGF